MQKWIIIGILISLISAAGAFYYNSTQKRIQALIEQNATYQASLEAALQANQRNVDTIDQMQEDFAEVRENYEQVQDEFQLIRMQNKELRERVAEQQLSTLAVEKTELVERTINVASDNALRCFELMSGAPLTDKEKNAKNEREFNAECPWLYLELVGSK